MRQQNGTEEWFRTPGDSMRFLISFSNCVLGCSLLCGSSNMLGTAGRVSPAQKWFSHKAECTLMAVGKSYSIDLFISSFLEDAIISEWQSNSGDEQVFFKESFFALTQKLERINLSLCIQKSLSYRMNKLHITCLRHCTVNISWL